ncbi:MAG: preprotein translocase subunit SecY [Nanoarchaeota archaeon]|nr:preprotein translocase subunit SecY [Nanoarchaeota archaeon]MBU1321373.1 preprotein translocase subunit SecY [Nanoarchaeota archaeon]MBU1597365.1 preprotein translocase subunit SecY [Nanoarchaeota archaeon]MBU2441280.1 preprotein translocase subunit SecY [Nanoarchaeota archaeon]
MGAFDKILYNLPEVQGPTQKKLSFKEKLKWTLITLVLFFILGLIPLYGLGGNALQQFEFLSIILGASFGSIISLGIGPIVTASIVLQLLNGSGLVKFDLTTTDGKKRFQGTQKLMSVGFIILEAFIYIQMGGLSPKAGVSPWILIFQLFLGGLMIMFMDEVVSKWGFGSGVSLFIAAGVSQSVFVRAFNPLPSPQNPGVATGAVPALIQSLSAGDPVTAGLMFAAIVATIVVFLLVVYAQSMRVEVPLSFGRVRGYGVRWPLHFFYTSNIPVILVAALIANIQLFGSMLAKWGHPILGQFSGSTPISGLASWLYGPQIIRSMITHSLQFSDLWHALVYILIMMIGAMIFSLFWVQTSGLDAKSQAKQMLSSGLQIPGFRKDIRVLERMLNRYIWPLTIMGGLAVGLLAALADISSALTSGTGLLLTVMIVYRLYEEIAQQHMMDMNPMMRKFITG